MSNLALRTPERVPAFTGSNTPSRDGSAFSATAASSVPAIASNATNTQVVDALESSSRTPLVASSVKVNPDHSVALKQRMRIFIEDLGRLFAQHYTPKEWKKETRDLDLAREVSTALNSIDDMSPASVKDFHAIVTRFVGALGDYHVGARFYSTESASLPFSVKGAQGRYFAVDVADPEFPLNDGDEIVSVDGQPIGELVADLQKDFGKNVPETDRQLAEGRVTKRSGARGMRVPQGDVEIEVRGKDGELRSHTVAWDYTPEQLAAPQARGFRAQRQAFDAPASEFEHLGTMLAHFWRSAEADGEVSSFALGARKSFVPDLGEVKWESEADSPLHARVYELEDGRKVGFVRIPHYTGGVGELLQFVALVTRFEATTDALVIDQVNNPGGSVAYLYALAAMLTDKHLFTPRHRMSITAKEVENAINLLNTPDSEMGPIPPALKESLRDNARFIVSEWKAGKTETSPYHLGFGDYIAPSPGPRFTKPMMVITNELDFSGGDFFPAIMQDNERATIFGARTAGAGGYVHFKDAGPNFLGIRGVSYTASLAERLDKSKIESQGVEPDVPYDITADDIQNGFEGYREAILDTLLDIMGEPENTEADEPTES